MKIKILFVLVIVAFFTFLGLAMYKVALEADPVLATTTNKIVWGLVCAMGAIMAVVHYLKEERPQEKECFREPKNSSTS